MDMRAIKTVGYQAEEELAELYKDSELLHRTPQFQNVKVQTLYTTYEEISQLWNEEVKYRPGFEVTDGTVTIPAIFAKISGVENTQNKGADAYWQTIEKLHTNEAKLVAHGHSSATSVKHLREIEPVTSTFIANGCLLRSKIIKSHGSYLYNCLDETMQDHLLDALQQLLNTQCIYSAADKIVAVALSLNDEIIQMLNDFDFTGKNPKLIYVFTSKEDKPTEEDAITAVFLHLIGFDVLFFVPTGYQYINNLFNIPMLEEHKIGKYRYDLDINQGLYNGNNSHAIVIRRCVVFQTLATIVFVFLGRADLATPLTCVLGFLASILISILILMGCKHALRSTLKILKKQQATPKKEQYKGKKRYTREYMDQVVYQRLKDYTELIDSMTDDELASVVNDIKKYNTDIKNNVQNPEVPPVLRDNPVIGYLRIMGKPRTYCHPIVSPQYAKQYPYCATLRKGSSIPIEYDTQSCIFMESSAKFYTRDYLGWNYPCCRELIKRRIEIVIMEQTVSCETINSKLINNDEISNITSLHERDVVTFISHGYYRHRIKTNGEVAYAQINDITDNAHNHNDILGCADHRFEMSRTEYEIERKKYGF